MLAAVLRGKARFGRHRRNLQAQLAEQTEGVGMLDNAMSAVQGRVAVVALVATNPSQPLTSHLCAHHHASHTHTRPPSSSSHVVKFEEDLGTADHAAAGRRREEREGGVAQSMLASQYCAHVDEGEGEVEKQVRGVVPTLSEEGGVVSSGAKIVRQRRNLAAAAAVRTHASPGQISSRGAAGMRVVEWV